MRVTIHMTLNINSAQVVEASVIVSNNSYFSELHHTRTITLSIQTFKGKLFSFLSRVLSRGFEGWKLAPAPSLKKIVIITAY